MSEILHIPTLPSELRMDASSPELGITMTFDVAPDLLCIAGFVLSAELDNKKRLARPLLQYGMLPEINDAVNTVFYGHYTDIEHPEILLPELIDGNIDMDLQAMFNFTGRGRSGSVSSLSKLGELLQITGSMTIGSRPSYEAFLFPGGPTAYHQRAFEAAANDAEQFYNI